MADFGREKGYDPRLRRAMTEIVEVLKKHDCAGYVALASPSHFEFRIHVDAHWNLLSIEENKDGSYSMRMRLKGSQGSPDRRAMANSTSAFIYNLRDNLLLQAKSFFDLTEQLEKVAAVDHNPGPINNDDREMEDKV